LSKSTVSRKDPDRRAKLRAWKEGRRAAREAAMPLSHDDLRAGSEWDDA
jgi:hypothetical protein